MSALLLIAAVSLRLGLAPFSGPAQPGSVAHTTKFSVMIHGAPGEHVRLRAVGVPQGYLASFCTHRVCAPFAVTLALPAASRDTIELQLIENIPGTRPPHTVTVTAGAARASIAFARGLH